MENWQYELGRARSEGESAGYKMGLTKGYSNGYQDGARQCSPKHFATIAAIGYLSHQHDLLDVLEGMQNEATAAGIDPQKRAGWLAAIAEISARLEPIEQVRHQTDSFTYNHKES